MTTPYAELHCLSNFTFLRGASHPEELVQQAADLGYQALALTDECSFAGVVCAHRTIKEENLSLKLIIGSEFRHASGLYIVLITGRKAYAELSTLITQCRRQAEKGHYTFTPAQLTDLQHCLLLWQPAEQEVLSEYAAAMSTAVLTRHGTALTSTATGPSSSPRWTARS